MAEAARAVRERQAREELKGAPYEIFMLLISGLSIANDLLIGLFHGPATEVILLMDVAIVPFLAFDFLYRLQTARPRRSYFIDRQGWADLIAIVPLLGVFRIFRCIRVGRALRSEGAETVVADLEDGRAAAIFLVTIWLVIAVVEIAGATVFRAEEHSPDANIKTASDAIWWGLVTITTVGYGDRVPVTTEGRIIGTFLLISGIALFSVLTAFIANVFITPHRRPLRRFRRRQTIAAEIADLRELLVRQDELTGTIRGRLGDLERSIGTDSRRLLEDPAEEPQDSG